MFNEIDTRIIIVKYRSLKLDLFNNLRNKKDCYKVEDPYF